MLDYIGKLMDETGFPSEAHDYFIEFYKRLDKSDIDFLNEMQSVYYLEKSNNADEANNYVSNQLENHAVRRNFDKYGFYMIFLLFCSQKLENLYKQKHYSKKLFIELMKDLASKNEECRQVHNAWGTFVFLWFHRHYLCTRFALGRFQYETITFEREYRKNEIVLKPTDVVYNLHIPSSGSIDEKIRMKSYKTAFDFYGLKKGDRMPIVCHSWILYPENKYIFDKHSNLYSFLNDFDIIYSGVCDNAFPNAWRVFNTDFTGDTNILPQNSSLQKNIVKWLKSGKKIGDGYGVLIFDGEKIINKNQKS